MSEDNNLANDLAAAWDAAEGEIDDFQEERGGYSEPEAFDGADTESRLAESEHEEIDGEPERQESGDSGQRSKPDLREASEKAGKGKADSDESAPVGLPPAAREAWKDTPKPVREALAKREKDYEAGIMKYAGQAKKGDSIDQVIAPYRQLFAMNRTSPPQMIGDVLGTAAMLQMGSPQQKATLVANMVKQFGVDIKALDAALVGESVPEEVQQQSQFEQMLNERLSPLQQQLQHYQQRDQQMVQRTHQEISSELQQFASNQRNEFYSDVKMDMADIMDMAANRNMNMSLQDAYERACKLHPEISKIIASRSSGMGRRKQAASSVRGGPGGTGDGLAGADLRSAIEAAWDTAGNQ